jgi:hypothetical protein
MKVERGTWCVVIEQQLITASCPLPMGGCMWKHQLFGHCTYDQEFAESLTDSKVVKNPVAEFAAHVGLDPIDPEIVKIIRRSLISVVKKEVST